MMRLTNLNDCVSSNTIFQARMIYGLMEFIVISDILLVIILGTDDERENFIFSACMILMDEIFEFFGICMNVDTILMNISKLHCSIIQIYWNILYILTIVITLIENSIAFLSFVNTIVWIITRIQVVLIDASIFNFFAASIHMYSYIMVI